MYKFCTICRAKSSRECSVNVDGQACFYPDEVKSSVRWPRIKKWQATCFMRSEGAQSCWLFAIPWTVADQAPLSMEFSKQEYWSDLPFLSPGNLPNTGSIPGLPHCRQRLYPLSHQRNPPDSLKIQPLTQSCSRMEEQNEPAVYFW